MACATGGGWGSPVISGCTAAKKQAWSLGLEEAHAMLRDRLGPNRTLISNYATPEALKYCTGGMVERFTPDQGINLLKAIAGESTVAATRTIYFQSPLHYVQSCGRRGHVQLD